ncbi:MAG: DUF503 domain-containing protein [Anaerolineales bacterium]|nr:DUF503 domain-containing protein [Anaerolineales bacterium]
MSLGLLTLVLQLPGCASLKEKRSRLKPLLARLHREFNISVAEIDRQDAWQEATIACALVSNHGAQAQRSLQAVGEWVEARWPDVQVSEQHLEII